MVSDKTQTHAVWQYRLFVIFLQFESFECKVVSSSVSFCQHWLEYLAVCMSVCVLSLQEVMLAGPIYTWHQHSHSLPLSLFLHLSLPTSLPSTLPSFICSRHRALVWSFLFLYFLVLCSLRAIQNEFAYGKYTSHATWKSPFRPAVCSCYKLSRLYLVLDRPLRYYNYHQHQKGYLGKLYLEPPPHFPLPAVSL